MRPYQVFASLAPDRAREVLRTIHESTPAVFAQAVAVASSAMHARPVFLQRQPFEKRADAVRRCLSRVSADPLAEEMLAVYFLQCRKELLVEWLDVLGLKHEDGALQEDSPTAPDAARLSEAVRAFRKPEQSEDRELLLRAFAAQSAIEWPELERLILAPPA